MDAETLAKLRARALYFWAISKDKRRISSSVSYVTKLLSLDEWGELTSAVEWLPKGWGCEVSDTGLKLSRVNPVVTGAARKAEREIFEYWREKTGRSTRTKFTDLRRKSIRVRRRSFTDVELKRAIDGLMASPYHQGDNDHGTIYTEVSNVFGNHERTEKFLHLPIKDIVNDRLSDTEQAMEARRNKERKRRARRER